jgi:hypothetical protein
MNAEKRGNFPIAALTRLAGINSIISGGNPLGI